MKKKNSKCEFSSQRNLQLLQNFRESIARQSKISAKRAFHDAAEAPAPRFWVSEARALRIISFLAKGNLEVLESMLPLKREMYIEIWRRVERLRALCPDKSMGDLVFEVVNNPAPRSYLSWHYVQILINRQKSLKSRS